MVNFRDNGDIKRILANAFRNNTVSSTTTTPSSSQINVIGDGDISDAYQNWQKEQKETLELAEKSGYKRHLKIEDSQVKNAKLNYNGDVYSIEFNDFNVTIHNKTKDRTITLNLSNLLNGMERKEKVKFMKNIQKLPGEVLEDLAIEVDRINSSQGQDMHTVSSNPEFTAGGYYAGMQDEITTGSQSLVHELGHAVDYQGVGNLDGKNNYSRVEKNQNFKRAFEIGLERFKKAGFKRYDYNNKNTWSSPLEVLSQRSNYCTSNVRELWAELYQALTTGTCKSMNTIIEFFPEAIEEGKKILNEIRAESETARHNTTMRSALNKIRNSHFGL